MPVPVPPGRRERGWERCAGRTPIEGGGITRIETSTKASGEVVDLLAALQKSVAAAKTARGEADSSDDSDDTAEDEKQAKKAS